MIHKTLLPALVLSMVLVTSCERKTTTPAPIQYKTETFVPGAPFHGLHGLTFGQDGMIYVASVVGMSVYKVDPNTGEISVFIEPPDGHSDDVEFSSSGGLAWTAFGLGKVFYQTPQGERRVLAENLMGMNSLAFNDEGRLFATQVFAGDALWELHLSGKTAPRKVMEGMGGLNGFDFGPDGKLYGPLWFKGEIARVDVDAGTLEVVSSGMQVPAAVNFDSQGVLHAIDNETGEIFQVNISSGERTLIATAPTNLDNLAFDKDDRLYVTNMSDAAIYEVDRQTGEITTLVSGALTVPGGIDAYEGTLYVADTFNFSKVDLGTGEVSDFVRLISEHEYATSVHVTDQQVLLASANSGMVQSFDRLSEERTARWTGFMLPVDVTELPDGRVAVLEGVGRITLVSGDAGETRDVLIEGLQDTPSLSYHDGALFVTEGAVGLLSKVDLETGEKTLIADGLAGPEGFAIAGDGTLFVAEVGKGQITEIKPDGTTRAIAEGLKLGLLGSPLFPPSNIPTGVALGQNGELYVSSDIENSIYRITPQ
jgi:sugar lactone lactonase YvrE